MHEKIKKGKSNRYSCNNLIEIIKVGMNREWGRGDAQFDLFISLKKNVCAN